jgi:hypothetical protein
LDSYHGTLKPTPCHPEATRFSAPKDLGAPRESPALFAGDQTARPAHILINLNARHGHYSYAGDSGRLSGI